MPIDTSICIIETTAQIPRLLIERKVVLYTYFLEICDKNDETNNTVKRIYEQLFSELEQIRHLNIELKPKSVQQTVHYRSLRMPHNFMNENLRETAAAVDVQINLFQFDGLILFGDVFKYSMKDELAGFKMNELKNELPIRILFDFKPDVIYSNQVKFFEVLQRLYDCLCANDATYRKQFEEVSCNKNMFANAVFYLFKF
jgi:hypothetical protein